MGVVSGAQNNYNSKITGHWLIIDYHNKYKNYFLKVWNIVRITKIPTQRHEMIKSCWNNGANRLAQFRLCHKHSTCKKVLYLQRVIKHNKMRYACSYVLILSVAIAPLKLSIIFKNCFLNLRKHKHMHVKWKLDNTESKKVSYLFLSLR